MEDGLFADLYLVALAVRVEEGGDALAAILPQPFRRITMN